MSYPRFRAGRAGLPEPRRFAMLPAVMIQLDILSGQKTGTQVVLRRFPFSIGRSADSNLLLQDSGVWDLHLQIEQEDLELIVRPGPDAIVLLNGVRAEPATALREGDVLELGSVRLRFGLSPTRQRDLLVRETLTWILLAAVSLGQVALIYWLSE